MDRDATEGLPSLLERLGRPADSRIAIIACDGLGMWNAANAGVYSAIRDGVGSTSAIAMPCPWARGAAAEYQGDDVGVSLTLNAEFEHYRWGPLTHAPSLLDGDGGFPRTVPDLWDHADVDELRRECRAQLERAVLWGFDVSHLSTHLGAMYSRPEFFDVYLELAWDFALPISLPDPSVDLGYPAHRLAAEEGILFPDRSVSVAYGEQSRERLEAAIAAMPPGVTLLHLRPALDTSESRAVTPQWTAWVSDHHLATNDTAFARLIERCGVEIIGFRELRDAQRAQKPDTADLGDRH